MAYSKVSLGNWGTLLNKMNRFIGFIGLLGSVWSTKSISGYQAHQWEADQEKMFRYSNHLRLIISRLSGLFGFSGLFGLSGFLE